jgi:hypothetical protein
MLGDGYKPFFFQQGKEDCAHLVPVTKSYAILTKADNYGFLAVVGGVPYRKDLVYVAVPFAIIKKKVSCWVFFRYVKYVSFHVPM